MVSLLWWIPSVFYKNMIEIEERPVMAPINYSEVVDIKKQCFEQLDSDDDDSEISSNDSTDDSYDEKEDAYWDRLFDCISDKYCCLHACNIVSPHCHCNYASLVLIEELHINDAIINNIRLVRQNNLFEKNGSLKNICLRFLSRYIVVPEPNSLKKFAPPQITKELFHDLKMTVLKLGPYNCVCKKKINLTF